MLTSEHQLLRQREVEDQAGQDARSERDVGNVQRPRRVADQQHVDGEIRRRPDAVKRPGGYQRRFSRI